MAMASATSQSRTRRDRLVHDPVREVRHRLGTPQDHRPCGGTWPGIGVGVSYLVVTDAPSPEAYCPFGAVATIGSLLRGYGVLRQISTTNGIALGMLALSGVAGPALLWMDVSHRDVLRLVGDRLAQAFWSSGPLSTARSEGDRSTAALGHAGGPGLNSVVQHLCCGSTAGALSHACVMRLRCLEACRGSGTRNPTNPLKRRRPHTLRSRRPQKSTPAPRRCRKEASCCPLTARAA